MNTTVRLELGITVEKLTEAVGEAGARSEPAMLGRGHSRTEGYRERLHAAAAVALGIRVTELELAFANGQTVRELAAARDVKVIDLRAALKQVHRDEIQRAVDGGELSQGQADLLQEKADFAPWLTEDGYDCAPPASDIAHPE